MSSARIAAGAAVLFILGGIVHVALAPVLFDELNMRVMWFVSQGLMGIFLGFLNLIVLSLKQPRAFHLWVTNLVNVLTIIFLFFYLQVDKDLQGYLMAVVLLVMTIASWRHLLKALSHQ